MNRITETPFLTVQECADLVRLSTKTVYSLIGDGKIPAIKVGDTVRVPVAWRDALLKAAGEAVADAMEANGWGSHRAGEGGAAR